MELFFVAWLLLAPSARADDRCARLAAEACRSPAGVEQKDPTGGALGYDPAREWKRLFTGHDAWFAGEARQLVGAEGPSATLAAQLGLPNDCASSAPCRDRATERLADGLLFDLSNGKVGREHLPDGLLAEASLQAAEARLSGKITADSDPATTRKLTKLVRDLRDDVVEAAWNNLPHNFETAALLDRISKVEYADDHCAPGLFEGPLSGIAQIGAYYVRETNQVRVCRGLTGSATSMFTLASVLAHEIAHSIDPCTLRENSKVPASPTVEDFDLHSPWRTLAKCLRDPRATGARFPGDHYDTKSCRYDQLSETIPDFIAAEVVGKLIASGRLPAATPDQALAGLANAWRIGCRAHDAEDDRHLPIRDRIGKILARQPAVRAALACPPLPATERTCAGIRPEQPVPFPGSPGPVECH